MQEPVLTINAGSSSLKFSLFETSDDRTLKLKLAGEVEEIGKAAHLKVTDDQRRALADEATKAVNPHEALAAVQDWLGSWSKQAVTISAVGHRLVHGGERYRLPVLVDQDVLRGLDELIPLAPLHQPQQLDAIRAVARLVPNARQVACFDTAFHATQSALARNYGLPRKWTERGLRGYGFHGLSYEYIVSALPRIAPELVGVRLVVAHLGNGASLCAIAEGRSVATTMGLTALDGLVMGTRCGSIDPGVLLYLLQHEKMSPDELQTLLYQQSGLLGVSGLSADMRELLDSRKPAAKEAVDLFIYRITRELASLVGAMGGLDAVIFTGGIGEHAPPIRAQVVAGARWLGLDLDEAANARAGPRISPNGSKVSAWVIPTDENLVVARHTRWLLDKA
ncbi:MAG TPA: acetate/propionate family kinase [Steroidobacteraceae bacterium]|jgi:acetate kinase|nr:acetate/propionate family kinase [Steroidobacteraceae bacterium]